MFRKFVRLGKRLGLSVLIMALVVFLYYQRAPSEIVKLHDKSLKEKLAEDKAPPAVEGQVLKAVTGKTPANRNQATRHWFEFDESDTRDENGNPYRIVIWKRISGKPGYLANPKECLGNIQCEVTYDRSNLDKVHAVVFPSDSLSGDLPSVRHPWQIYTWWTQESPLHSPRSGFENYYNLTFHYRTDAGVYAPYGSINLILRNLAAAGETDLEALLAKKRMANKMAAWAVSNCYQPRMNYAKKLMEAGLDVDTFGGCFGGRQIGSGKYSDSFYDELSKYRFYFSFENSISCKDYFTEKFWFNGLRSGAVPVVWGPRKEDLLKVAPTKSFIHSSDFASHQELVAHLKYLASNETAYAEYLQWRTWVKHPERMEERLRMENMDNDLRSFCKLCAIVQSDGRNRKKGIPNPVRVIKSIHDAWNGAEEGRCHS